ncbi:MAG: hypothetical protein SFY66_26835 [Oculatellaceae cyanobacterium bins.114]|nr:hypothetical protein [Oculatellaceae cyanobacterium bins.114]
MTVDAFQKLLTQTQAQVYQGLSYLFADAYDVIRYDSHMHRLLAEANIDCQTYVTLPWLDYCNPVLKVWTILAMQHDGWKVVKLPNPFYQETSACAGATLREAM